MAKFDLNKLFGKFRKNKEEEYAEENEEFNEEEYEEESYDEEEYEDEETEEAEEDETETSGKKKFSLKNLSKKQKIITGSAAAAIIVLGSIPLIVQMTAESEVQDTAAGITQIQQEAFQKPVRPPKHRPKKHIRKPAEHKKQKTVKHERKTLKHNRTEIAKTAVPVQQNKRKTIKTAVNIPDNITVKQAKAISSISPELDKKIQKNIISDNLTGKKDPLALVDEEIVKSRNYNAYLQQKLALMQKLINYYKRKQELEKILALYQMSYGNNNVKNNEKEKMKKMLKEEILPLKAQINQLTQKLEKIKTKPKKNLDAELKNKKLKANNEAFNQMTKNFSDLQIFMKDGKLIAVVKTSNGQDRIFREGDYYSGYKIDKILPNMIVFEKDGTQFYYNYASKLGINYQTAEIPLPVKIKDTELKGGKTANNNNVKEYKTVNEKEKLRQLLQSRLKKIQ